MEATPSFRSSLGRALARVLGGGRGLTGLALLVLAVQLGLAFAWVEPAPLSIDEVIYHRMTRGLVEGDGLTLWNGFRETPSPELRALYIRPNEGRLVAPYPYGFAAAAAPFYALFGYRGLFLVNALAYVGVLAIGYHLARRLLGSPRAALASAALLGAGTYAWEYSMAAWPHSLALLLGTAAAATALGAHRAEASRHRAMALAAATGLLLGAGTLVRFDVFFLVPLAGLLFLLAHPTRARELFALGAGLLPGLGLASLTNWLRWETWVPFSYGSPGGTTDPNAYLPLLGAFALGVALLKLALLPPGRRLLSERSLPLALGALAALALALVVPALREAGLQMLQGAHAVLVDMRSLAERSEPAMARTETGAVVYYGGVKKALLQSCPYLALLVLPLAAVLRGEREALPRVLLFAPVVAIAGLFSFFSWHGGLALNMRYFLPLLPFACILVVDALGMLGRRAHAAGPLVATVACAAAATAFLVLRPANASVEGMTPLLLDVPLLLATGLLVLCALQLLRASALAATLALALAGASIGWSSAMAFGYDAAWSHARRSAHHAFAERVASRIEADSLLFVDSATPFYGVIEHRPRVRIAIPWADRFRDARALIAHHQRRGRPVYGALAPDSWRAFAASDALQSREPRPLERIGPFRLARLPSGEKENGTRETQ